MPRLGAEGGITRRWSRQPLFVPYMHDLGDGSAAFRSVDKR